MTGCSAPDCNNSSKKSYIMKVFPRNPEQRLKWAANVGRQNWNPTNASYLCEVHFDPTMWENRIDGVKKLKPNAVPTIFGFYLKKQDNEKNDSSTIEFNQEQSNCKTDNIQINHLSESEVFEKSGINPSSSNGTGITVIEENSDQLFEMRSITQEIQNSPSTNYSQQESIKEDEATLLLQQKNKSLLNKQAAEIMMLKNKLKATRNALIQVRKRNGNNLYKIKLKRLFTHDQISTLLTNRKRPQHWSNDTIIKALRLKFACGERGYEELIRQNMPLPSIRTLQMRLQGLEFSNGISDEIFEFLKIKVSQFKDERDKECSLVMDEMHITSG